MCHTCGCHVAAGGGMPRHSMPHLSPLTFACSAPFTCLLLYDCPTAIAMTLHHSSPRGCSPSTGAGRPP